MKIFFLLILIILFCFYLNSQPYSFFVAGHTYGTPGYPSQGLYDGLVNLFPYIKSRPEIKFGVLTGDIVVNSNNTNWDYVDQDIAELGLPIYFTLGNHDMSNVQIFEQRYGKTFYTFLYKNDLFIILNPYVSNWNINQEQLSMINDSLNEYNQYIDNIFVLFHQVLWWSENNIYKEVKPNSTDGRADSINFWTDLEPVFYKTNHKVFMFAGDVGATNASFNLMYDHYENMTFVASGMGNKIADNFIIVNVDADKNVTIEPICIGNNDLNCLGEIQNYDIFPNPHNTIEELNIYPNPFTDYISICGLESYKLNVFDCYGRELFNTNITENFQNINLDFLEKGIYLLKFHNNSDIKKFKIIKD